MHPWRLRSSDEVKVELLAKAVIGLLRLTARLLSVGTGGSRPEADVRNRKRVAYISANRRLTATLVDYLIKDQLGWRHMRLMIGERYFPFATLKPVAIADALNAFLDACVTASKGPSPSAARRANSVSMLPPAIKYKAESVS